MNIFFLLISVVGFFMAHQPVCSMNKRSVEDPLSLQERRLIERMGNSHSGVPSRQYFTSNLESYDWMTYVKKPSFSTITEDKKTFRKLMNEKKYEQALQLTARFDKNDPEFLHCAALAAMSKGNFPKGQQLLKFAKEPRLLWTGFKNGSFYEQYFVYNSHQKSKISKQKQPSLILSTNNSSSSSVFSPTGSISPVPSPEPINQKALVAVSQPVFDLHKHLKKGLKGRKIQRALSKAYTSGDTEALFVHSIDLVEAFASLSEKDQKSEVGTIIKKLAQGAIERATKSTMPPANEVTSYARYKKKLREYDDKLPLRGNAVAMQSVQPSDQEKKFTQDATFNAALVLAQSASAHQTTSNPQAEFEQYVSEGKKEKSEDLVHAVTLNAAAVLASHFNAVQETSAARSAVEQFDRTTMDSFKTLLNQNTLLLTDARKFIQYKRDDDIEYDITQEENDQLAALIEKQLQDNPWETARLLRYLDSQKHQLSLSAILQLAVTKKIDADAQNYLQGIHFMTQPGRLSYAIEKLEAIKSEKRIETLPYLVNCYLTIPAEQRKDGDQKAEKCLSDLCSYVEESLHLQKKGALSPERLELSRQLAYEVAFASLPGQQVTDEINNSILELQGLYLGLTNPALRAQALDLYAKDCFGLLNQNKIDFVGAEKSLQRFTELKENVAQPTPVADLFILELQRRMSLRENKDDLSKHADWLRSKSDQLQKLCQELKNDDDRRYAGFVVSQCNDDLDNVDYHIGCQHTVKQEYDKALIAYEKVGSRDLATFIKARVSIGNIKYSKSKKIDDFINPFIVATDLLLAGGLHVQLSSQELSDLKDYYQRARVDEMLGMAFKGGNSSAYYVKAIFDLYLNGDVPLPTGALAQLDTFLKNAELQENALWQTRLILSSLAMLSRSAEKSSLSKQDIIKFNQLCNKLQKVDLKEKGIRALAECGLNGIMSALANAKKTNQNERLIEKLKEVSQKHKFSLLPVIN